MFQLNFCFLKTFKTRSFLYVKIEVPGGKALASRKNSRGTIKQLLRSKVSH